METQLHAESLLETIPDDTLLNPAGYAPEQLREWLRSRRWQALFDATATSRGNLEIIRAAATRSVELALSLGITVTLFTDPVRRYRPDVWQDVFVDGFISKGWLGGMMITEPGCGTDMMACATEYQEGPKGPRLTGHKHWAGLSGLADYWLVLARDPQSGKGFRFPSLNFYICRSTPESFRLLKRYTPAGLRSIPYGLSRIDAGPEQILAPLLTGSRMDRFRQIHAILHRSRISISAITCGVCARIADDIQRHVRERIVFGKPLESYGQVQARVAEIEAARDVSRVLYEVALRETSAADAPGSEGVPAQTANIVKVVASDLAFAAANSASQLLGGESYRTDTYIGRAAADLRPFRIFEGSNDVLCDAIAQAAEKAAKTGGETFADAVGRAFAAAELPPPPLGVLAGDESISALPQGARCLAGRILANVTVARWCLDNGVSGERIQPLLARAARDLATASFTPAAGLTDY